MIQEKLFHCQALTLPHLLFTQCTLTTTKLHQRCTGLFLQKYLNILMYTYRILQFIPWLVVLFFRSNLHKRFLKEVFRKQCFHLQVSLVFTLYQNHLEKLRKIQGLRQQFFPEKVTCFLYRLPQTLAFTLSRRIKATIYMQAIILKDRRL